MQTGLKLNALVAVAACAAGIAAAPIASAQVTTTANGPYYATPSWDQKLTTNRFVILANWNGEAVLDRETGLVWERSPSQGKLPYSPEPNLIFGSSATQRCRHLFVAGRGGWRVPSYAELSSLLDPTAATPPALPAGHPFIGINDYFYWTKTRESESNPLYFAVVNLGNPAVFGIAVRSASLYVWCVRGGGEDDPR